MGGGGRYQALICLLKLCIQAFHRKLVRTTVRLKYSIYSISLCFLRLELLVNRVHPYYKHLYTDDLSKDKFPNYGSDTRQCKGTETGSNQEGSSFFIASPSVDNHQRSGSRQRRHVDPPPAYRPTNSIEMTVSGRSSRYA